MLVGGLWVWLDRDVPPWDPAEHLSFSMNYWWTLSHNSWLSGDTWRSLWALSPKYPPVLYLVAALVHGIVGPGPDRAMLANGLFTLVMLVATYGLGRHIFTPRVGLLAAGLCLLMPRLVQTGLDYQLDYPLTAMTLVSLWCLTVWRDAKGGREWLWMLAFGVSFGLALMTKQSALLFLLVPLAWVSVTTLIRRRWGRGLQLGMGAIATVLVMLPWLSVNWLFQFSIWGSTNVGSAADEGDPGLGSLAAWTYYWQDLPAAVSWLLLLVPLVGIILWYAGWLPGRRTTMDRDGTAAGRRWLLVYLVGAYLLWSAIANKDPRYIAPYLPALGVFLAWGLDCWWRKGYGVVVSTLALTLVINLLNLFPTGIAPAHQLAQTLAPGTPLYPYTGEPFPNAAIVAHIADTQPHQISTVAGLFSTEKANQHNFSYYGKLNDYQVYGRQVGSRISMLEKDLGSLHWFYVQREPGQPWPRQDEGDTGKKARQLDQSPEFVVDRIWEMPDGVQLYLYRREQLPVTVEPISSTACPANAPLQLSRVDMPAQAPPGQPLPIAYEWTGRWQALQQGRVLLDWAPIENTALPSRTWIHDHGIGLGTLRPAPISAGQTTLGPAEDIDPNSCFRVTERTATLPPETALAGTYTLSVRYLDASETDATPQPIEGPEITVILDAQAPPVPAPELDWVTQLREVARFLPQGPDSLNEVFDPLGRVNLYDPNQNYLVQAEATLKQRWQANSEQVDYGYGLVLSQILQLDAESAIATLQQLTQQDVDNPYAHAYLGFVHLYAFQPGAAQKALRPALELAPESPEIQGLSALAALLQGNLWGAWQRGRTAISLAHRPAAINASGLRPHRG